MIQLPLDIAACYEAMRERAEKNANFDLLGFIRKRMGQAMETENQRNMDYEKINTLLQEHFDKMNNAGLGELFLFTDSINQFVENKTRRERLLKAVVDICGGYQMNARTFVNLISYEDFKKRRGISEITALGLRLYLLYQCGVDWEKPHATIKGV